MTLTELQTIRVMFPEIKTLGDLQRVLSEGNAVDLENLTAKE